VEVRNGVLVFTSVATNTVLLKEIQHSFCTTCGPLGTGNGSITFASQPDERIYGLGEHRTGKLDNHGIDLNFMDAGVYDHHQGSDIIMPFYLSSKNYGFIWNHASFGNFTSTDEEITWVSMSAKVLDFWVTTSDTTGAVATSGSRLEAATSSSDIVPSNTARSSNRFKQMLSQYADSTGHPPEMPVFATGFWQCKNRYRSQDELLTVAREYKKRKLPISTIVIDYLHVRVCCIASLPHTVITTR
jgi:alpha-D-xyloside xylohydrolase